MIQKVTQIKFRLEHIPALLIVPKTSLKVIVTKGFNPARTTVLCHKQVFASKNLPYRHSAKA
ncbi:CLUMA_CG006398, isoform A [Clunio marinus]|uniref:CLUMA_CG006398, isoform A n=1 Tax=Clunio marinus TaxID=568069 RepID=A0A1J1HXU2_9DIPT|nr:CLUMA_CG006398, isoform A [Clunio marinus]